MHIMNNVGDHNVLGIIDAVENIIYKHFTSNNNAKWIDIFDKIVDTYNKTPHISLRNVLQTGILVNWMMEVNFDKINCLKFQLRIKAMTMMLYKMLRKSIKQKSFKRGND